MGNSAMQQAWIAGEAAALDSAIAEAARLLDASRHPLIAGLGTDVAGARAAIKLAERTGAVIDHMNSDALLCDLDVVRASGVMQTTLGEVQVRADLLLLVGPGLVDARLHVPARLWERARSAQSGIDVERRIFWLSPGRDLPNLASLGMTAAAVGKEPRDLPVLLAALRARVAGRPTGKTHVSSRILEELSAALKAARFGVAIWSAAALDALTIELLCGLVNDLNTATRFSTLALSPADNAMGVLQTCGWMTGFPVRTGFGRGFPEHDPWRFDSRRLAESGEIDCVLWISAYRAATPGWREPVPTIALMADDATFRVSPRVRIKVGRPGVDHAGIEHLVSTGTLTAVDPAQPSDTISVAEAIARIAAALPSGACSW
jgi:formylmethanofuran dehydrogenase subunit B